MSFVAELKRKPTQLICEILDKKNSSQSKDRLFLMKVASIVAPIAIAILFGLFYGALVSPLMRDLFIVAERGESLIQNPKKRKELNMQQFSVSPQTRDFLFGDTWILKHIVKIVL